MVLCDKRNSSAHSNIPTLPTHKPHTHTHTHTHIHITYTYTHITYHKHAVQYVTMRIWCYVTNETVQHTQTYPHYQHTNHTHTHTHIHTYTSHTHTHTSHTISMRCST